MQTVEIDIGNTNKVQKRFAIDKFDLSSFDNVKYAYYISFKFLLILLSFLN